jgi:hypothetical protein
MLRNLMLAIRGDKQLAIRGDKQMDDKHASVVRAVRERERPVFLFEIIRPGYRR